MSASRARSGYSSGRQFRRSFGQKHSDLLKLAIGALGVVYGDIGTSPLYALKESFHPAHGLALNPENIFGILSLVFWSLTLVVMVKYLVFIVRADNRGEGGIMALLALLIPRLDDLLGDRTRRTVIFLGLVGAGLLYGDGVITPAISVLSAVEGLQVATPAFKPIIVPLTIGILIAIFSAQSRGTARIGAIFGPATLLWFLTLMATGVPWILKHPEILSAVDPSYAVKFFLNNGSQGFFVLSSVVLCITGGEALYADMGHFGKQPIRWSWFSIVFPALLINYFGQGALILERGASALDNPFYGLVSGWLLYPLVAIATMATVIASQALISGAFSLTQQAVQLGYFPRVTIRHTSRTTEGQIYVPRINSLLMVSCIALVLFFQESTHLASAYGIAVTGTMVITSILFFFVTQAIWGWRLLSSLALVGLFLTVDLAFFFANIVKLFSGGWVPIMIAGFILAIMTTWKRGREVLSRAMMGAATPLSKFIEEVAEKKPHRVRGTAVFMTLTRDIAPSVLLHHFNHNQTLHHRIILLSIVTETEPDVPALERVRVTELDQGFVKVVARYGYMETPDIQEILILCEGAGLTVNYQQLSFYLGRETFLTTGSSGMANWRKRLFVLLSRNARSATEFFNLPPNRVIEIGSQIQI